ncbi:MAG: ABC transporter substrate-binding protein [Brasilonema angustatum HA4187-MV1]|jgi:branched-chain amino acid transport system substrate-binding protein|nr:ABC transporter substrate-binding protein [Brasilonema angustatum HA4187-MV1]
MAKFALLIGVSEYEQGLTPLPAAAKDVEAMQQVLQNPEIGGFDEVKPLLNLERHKMEEAIETLFSSRQKDDLVLLFFSGHGIKDESGRLYFATHNTRKTDKGELVRATAVPASFVHEIMRKSRSKHQVVILDCCFSGAFAEGLSAKDDGFVDVKNQLGGEGRAVLTSSTSTQYSFEQQGADISTYTRYIVEGLGTGVADRDQDGWISVDELHEYAKQKVQEVAPAMNPEIYAIKEGYKIKLAKAPIGDPRLIYRREVEYWVKGGDGEISFTGRTTLDEIRNTLGLSSQKTATIEAQVLEPIKVYKQKLERYEQALRTEIEHGFPLSQRTRADLTRLQQVLGLRDEHIALVEAPIIAEQQPSTPGNPTPVQQTLGLTDEYIALVEAPIIAEQQPSTPGNPTPHPSRKKNFLLFMGLFIGAVSCFGAGVWFSPKLNQPPTTAVASCQNNTQPERGLKISLGEEILLKGDTNSDKQAGIQAFANNDFQTAIEKFTLYRQTCRLDPEALIYLNNAQALKKGNPLKIAVSVPIGSTQNIAKEILRGVAQAQDEVNSNGGINGKLLQVAIANDDNDSSEAVQLATQFVKDASILAVVGHNASNASLSAAPAYQRDGLVMMSPTSFAQNLTGIGNYIFRTVPNVSLMADGLSRYAIKAAGKTNFFICVDSKAIDNQSFKDEFVKAIKAAGGTINSTNCDVSASNFNPNAVISQAISNGADALVLGLYIDRIKQGLAVAQANKGRLALFSSPTLYTSETFQVGKADINGMVLAAPWHPQVLPGNPFRQKSQKFWGGIVNWRTATAYDATKAIIAGLQQSNTRDELQQVLHSPNFSVNGATGKIQFSSSGDRIDNPIFLVKVQQKSGSNDYEFVWLPNPK